MAARSTHISAKVRGVLIRGILAQEEKVGFRDLDHMLTWYLSYVGDGYVVEDADEATILASHAAVLTIQMMIIRAHEKSLSVVQTIQLLQTAQPARA